MTSDVLTFFNELQVNNNREWFLANKSRWEAIRADFVVLTQQLIDEMTAIDHTLGHPQPKDCIYRIYRDLRFSPDKRPYKTHIACFLASGGHRCSGAPGYYLQIGLEDYGLEGNCTLGGGIFMPDATTLAAIRQEIFYNYDEFRSIVENKTFRRYFGTEFFTTGKLTRAPKGYPNDWEGVNWLKFKDYCTMHSLPAETVTKKDFAQKIIDIFKASLPLNQFIQRAMGMEIEK